MSNRRIEDAPVIGGERVARGAAAAGNRTAIELVRPICYVAETEKLRIDLSDDLAGFVAEVAGDDAGSEKAGDYVRSLIEEDRERRAWLRAEVRKGLESGDSELTIDQIWKRAVDQAKSRAA